MKCSSCGKNFDYEKYYGICPKCGTFQRQEEKEQQEIWEQFGSRYGEEELREELDTGDSHEELHDAYDDRSVHEGSPAAPKPEKKRPLRKLRIFLLALLVVQGLVRFAGLPLLEKAASEQAQKNSMVGSVPITLVQDREEELVVNGVGLEFGTPFILGGQDIFPDLPDGKKLVAVPAKGLVNTFYGDWTVLGEVYVLYEGNFYRSVDSYSMRNVLELQKGIQVLHAGSFAGEAQTEGCFVFLLDEDARAFTLCLEEQDLETSGKPVQNVFGIEMEIQEGEADEAWQ